MSDSISGIPTTAASTGELSRRMFRHIDKNGDGALSGDEMKRSGLGGGIDGGKSLSQAEARAYLSKLLISDATASAFATRLVGGETASDADLRQQARSAYGGGQRQEP